MSEKNLIQSAQEVIKEAPKYTPDTFSSETGINAKNYGNSWLSGAARRTITAFFDAVQGRSTSLGKGQYEVPLNNMPIELRIKVMETWVQELTDQLEYTKRQM